MSAGPSSSAVVAVDSMSSLSVDSSRDHGRPVGLFASSSSTAAMGLYVPATVGIRLINFGRIIFLTWLMAQQQFGLLSILLAVINILTPLFSIGLTEAVTRYVPQYEARGRLIGFLRRSLVLTLIVTAFTALAMLIVAPALGMRFFGQFFYDASIRETVHMELGDLTRLCAVVIGLLTLYFFILAILKGLRMIRALAVIELVQSLAFIALAGVACAAGRRSAFTITSCYAISLLVAVVFFGFSLSRVIRNWTAQAGPCDDPTLHPRLLAFSYWAMISGFTWQVLQYYPAWYLNKVMGNDAVAVFSAVRQIGQFVLLGAVTLVTVVMAAVTKTWETRGVEAADGQLSLAFRGAGVIMLLACGVVALSKDLIVRMFRPDYAPGADILPLQLVFFLIGGNFAFIAMHFNLIEKPRLHFLPYAVGVAANILLAYWFVGGRFARIASLPLWVAVKPWMDSLFSMGIGDKMGLGGASWSGVLAILCALITCLMLLRAEGRRLDRGSYIVLAASLLLTMNRPILIAGLLLFIWIAWCTSWIFSAKERHDLVQYARAVIFSLWRRPAARSADHARG